MIVRSKELKNFIDNVTQFNGFLIYGLIEARLRKMQIIYQKIRSDYSFGG